ncbi:hypothetical protein FSW04_20680 [Baekduia soli]|uniref:DUF1772 domain-containing protein n=1 Tax=Baekduia soli TaxID=496014 RepID=A0A5B8UAA9_9ACTN|nr:hypothetical protein [Baekduia soli]QEC49748.1 hypothetical protein FSW04_20680 [Baekduia soli]
MDLLTANLVVAAALAGLIWTIQVVHYPLFALVGAADRLRYQAEHQRRIARLVLPLMVADVALAVAVLVREDAALGAANAALAVGLFAITGLVYAPMHGAMAGGATDRQITRLVRANWVRTAAWTAQVVVALALR